MALNPDVAMLIKHFHLVCSLTLTLTLTHTMWNLGVCLDDDRVSAVAPQRPWPCCRPVVTAVHGELPDLCAEVIAILLFFGVEPDTCMGDTRVAGRTNVFRVFASIICCIYLARRVHINIVRYVLTFSYHPITRGAPHVEWHLKAEPHTRSM